MKHFSDSVSIIIPTYNRAGTIDRSIRSLLNQTYKDFEIIIVDDGSSDNTEEKIMSIKDKRIRYIRHEVNKGAAAARNTGISLASGRYIAFQDSDDEWMPEKLEKQINILRNAPEDTGVVYTGFWRIFPDRKKYIPSSRIDKKEGNIYYELLRGNFVGMPTVMIKRECFEKVGLFDESLPAREDWELFIRISKIFKFSLINEPLVIEYESDDSISKSKSANIRALMLIIQKHQQDFIKNRKAMARYYFQIGDHLFREGYLRRGRSYLKKALFMRPLRSKLLFALFLSLWGRTIYKKLS